MDAPTGEDAARAEDLVARPLGAGECAAAVVLPVVCLLLDPLVFRVGTMPLLGSEPMFPHLGPAAWVLVVLQGVALLLYALTPVRARAWHATAGALFLVGGGVALAMGLALLPLALPGLLVGIGFFGLVPLFASFVLLRRSVRALRRAPVWRDLGLACFGALGLALAVAPPAAAWAIGRHETRDALQRLEAGGPTAVADATSRLARVRWLIRDDDLFDAWRRAEDPAVQARLALAYEALTGRSVVRRQEEVEALED